MEIHDTSHGKLVTFLQFILVLGLAVMVLSLSACGGQDTPDDNTGITPPPTPTDMNTTLTPPADDSLAGGSTGAPSVDFGLEPVTPPTFDGFTTQQGTGLYTIVDGYAYALDPETLEPTGPKLDPVTHAPVEPEEPTEPEEPAEPEPVVSEDDGKLPNTGIFLEDD